MNHPSLRQAAFLVPLLASLAVHAEPVEVRQGQEIGSGYAFKRGDTCVVLTALHVVPQEVGSITVTDRGGVKRSGQRIYGNDVDVALVELAGASASACNEKWPDTAWLGSTKFTSKSQFEAVRHEPGGRETIVTLRYAGGTANSLTLAPVDKTTIMQSDSGSVVRQDGRLAGILTRVDPSTDRAEVLRFDVIDKLVGDRFRGAAKLAAVQLDGVYQRGRLNPNWSAFLRSWVSETAGRPVVAAQDPAGRCKIAVDVLEWRNAQVPNPEYEKAAGQDCSLMRLLGKSAQARCEEQKRSAVRTAPRVLPGYTMSMEVKMTPRSGPMLTKLVSGTVANEGGQRARTADVEFNAMQVVLAPAALELFSSGVCD